VPVERPAGASAGGLGRLARPGGNGHHPSALDRAALWRPLRARGARRLLQRAGEAPSA
jgi:hypothetical protein